MRSSRGHSVLPVTADYVYDGGKSKARTWRRMPRLQKLAIITLGLLITVALVYSVPSNLFLSGETQEDLESEVERQLNDALAQIRRENAALADVLSQENDVLSKIQAQRSHNSQPIQPPGDVAQQERQDPRSIQQQQQQQQPQPDANANINGNHQHIDVPHVPPVPEDQHADNHHRVPHPQPHSGVSVYDRGPANDQQRAVVGAMKYAWEAYRAYAWGHDQLQPETKSFEEWFKLGLTLIDALDTLYIMGLKTEFEQAKEWVRDGLKLDQNVDVNLFECTIRVLGGLLSTYALSQDELFLNKATDLGYRLAHAFNDHSGVPYSDVNLQTHKAHAPKWGPDSSTSEISTIQLEFRYLSHLTGDHSFDEHVTKIMDHLRSLPKRDGLVPIFINANTGQFRGQSITLGARGDSYYEYLLKQWLLTEKQEAVYKDMYLEAIAGVEKHLIRRTKQNQYTYIAEMGTSTENKMDHLVCFMPGLLALGAHHGLPSEHMTLAKELMRTCYATYEATPTGLAPEITHFDMNGHEIHIKPNDAHNLLRPETVESLFILYRLTKDQQYREWGWKIFQSFETHAKLPGGLGYSSITSVLHTPVKHRNKMESFFLGETLKYFYLLFEDDDSMISLDQFVLNTEAHPLPMFVKT